MTRNLKILTLAIVTSAHLAGCVNMPTPPAEIKGRYTSDIKYENVSCQRLSVESDSLTAREKQLVIAQEQRISDSGPQAFIFGSGKGDGIEANELATVRGEKDAVRRAMGAKNCY